MVNFDESLNIDKWYVMHTKCHHEKNVALRLGIKGFEPFVPVRSIMRRWKDRKKMVEFPLFPGYVFVRMPLIRKKDAVQIPGVVTIVGQGRPESIDTREIDAIRTITQAEFQYDPYPYLFSGMEVEVIRGPLKHVRGILCEKKNKHRLVINIEMINNSVATEIDAEDVRAV
jgi:transcription antitermination factor NusG